MNLLPHYEIKFFEYFGRTIFHSKKILLLVKQILTQKIIIIIIIIIILTPKKFSFKRNSKIIIIF
ncbi:MAG: hypothetical protein N7Q72_03855, partial [Spiroplasma sp. Tabriz.8]|nr:hypothetical protein [Candidatus Regiella insecticola]MCX2959563.1 hypothetical protein [Serratia symbiotica]MCZ8632379.1 hypothetical protein [Spiroplasma sp. Tabriz.8]